MRILVDADIFRYQHGSVMTKHPYANIYPQLKDYKVPASAEYICEIVDKTINEIMESTKGDEYICALSGSGNFRNDIAKQQPYKGNRDASVGRPYHYDTVGEHIKTKHPHIIIDGQEADDWLGITQRADPENTCISSRDKDLKTIYGWHHRFACGENQPEIKMHWMTPWESLHFFFYQMLIGDNTDNIPGCGKKVMKKWGNSMMLRREGVGSKAALTILGNCHTCKEMYEAVKAEYQKVFKEDHEEVMLEMARLLYIGQKPDNLFTWDWLDMNQGEDNVTS